MAEIGLNSGGRETVIRDPVPGSLSITAQLRQAILDGRYVHVEKLPAERQFAAAFGASALAATKAISIGPVTTQTARSLGIEVAAQARVFTVDGLVEAILEICETGSALPPQV